MGDPPTESNNRGGGAVLPEMPFLANVGLLLTYRCQVKCPHCILKAGPDRHESMAREDALAWVRQIAASGQVAVLALTGGEPFIDLETLQVVSETAAQCGLLVSIVTNAYWARAYSEALKVLRQLPSVHFLQVSTDIYHQISIPIAHVQNAVRAANELGIPYTVSVCTENESEPAYIRTVEELRSFCEPGSVRTAITFRAGRAAQSICQDSFSLSPEPPKSACTAAASPIVFPDGRVIGCIGPVIDLDVDHPLLLGSLRKACLKDVFDQAECNAVLHALRIWGPHKLIQMALHAGLKNHLPTQYVSNSTCNACFALMADPVIRNYLLELNRDHEFMRKVAYARVYYLGEDAMLRRLNPEISPG